MNEIVKVVLSDIAFSIFTFIVTYIVYTIRIKKSVMVLLQINIYNLYKGCETAQYRTAIDSKAFASMLKQYYALGGDEYIHDVERRFYALKEL